MVAFDHGRCTTQRGRGRGALFLKVGRNTKPIACSVERVRRGKVKKEIEGRRLPGRSKLGLKENSSGPKKKKRQDDPSTPQKAN